MAPPHYLAAASLSDLAAPYARFSHFFDSNAWYLSCEYLNMSPQLLHLTALMSAFSELALSTTKVLLFSSSTVSVPVSFSTCGPPVGPRRISTRPSIPLAPFVECAKPFVPFPPG